MSPVNEADTRGMPKFIIGDVPPRTDYGPRDRSSRRIYFGEDTDDYVVVDTGIKEFDFPLGETQRRRTSTRAPAGVKVGALPTPARVGAQTSARARCCSRSTSSRTAGC